MAQEHEVPNGSNGEKRCDVDEIGSQDETFKTEPEAKPRIRSQKEDEVLDACERRDVKQLQALAQSRGGFVTDELRQQACEFRSWYKTFVGAGLQCLHGS